MTGKILGPIGVAAMEKRGLNPETAVRLNVFTASRQDDGEVVPDPAGNILVFPFEEDGVTVGEKYRAAGKKFWQRPGGKRTFFNADALNDPGLVDGSLPLVVTEGEIDCLTAIDCGFPLAVSVPDGAPPPPKDRKKDGEADESGKFSFLWTNKDRLKRIRRFILAVDNDDPGKYLAEELVRRLGTSRCWFVTYPQGCKDINDVLMKHGADAARAVLEQAKPYPLKGIFLLRDYPDKPQIKTFSTGWPIVDSIFTPFAPSFTVVTGLPGSGKSTWLTGLAVNMAELHGWRWTVFSPEMPIVPHMRDKMRRIFGGVPAEQMNRQTLARVDAWINDRFVFIDHDTGDGEDEDLTLEWLMDRAYDTMMRFGVRGVIFDPWNEIEHAKAKWESMTEYTNRALRMLTKFTRRHGLATFLITHPTKEVGKDGKLRVPTLYDQDGCYSDDTEVLTRRGWLRHADIESSDIIACFSPDTAGLEWHRPERIVRKQHAGEMVRFSGSGFDFLVTPDHRMLIKADWEEPVGQGSGRGRPVRFEKGKWHFVEAEKVPRANFVIPKAARVEGGAEQTLPAMQIGGRSYPAIPFWRLVGWYIAEGSHAETGIVWSQGAGELADRFTATFAAAGIETSIGWQAPSGKGKAVVGRWYVGNRFCPILVRWFVEQCGKGAANKRMPPEAFDLPSQIKTVLLEAYLEGDGSRSGACARASTISRQLCDDLQRLAVELGIPTTSSESEGAQDHHHRKYQINLSPSHRSEAMLIGRNTSREQYCGTVWCLTVPTGAYFTRRNGKVAVSGNSAAFFNKPDFGIVVHRPNKDVDRTEIHAKKVKWEGTGSLGQVVLQFNRENSRYEQMNPDRSQDKMEL